MALKDPILLSIQVVGVEMVSQTHEATQMVYRIQQRSCKNEIATCVLVPKATPKKLGNRL